MRLLLSTSNKDKLKELSSILGDEFELLLKSDLNLDDLEIIEDGETLKKNAYKKAKELFDRTGENVIADDTGLFVDALGGKPGVYSARYSGEESNYQKNNKKLLKELSEIKDIKKRTAHFKTVICLITKDNNVYYVEGVLSGKIGFELKGSNGFGYDPLFILDNGLTLAEITEKQKNSISHRARALKELKKLLIKLKESEL